MTPASIFSNEGLYRALTGLRVFKGEEEIPVETLYDEVYEGLDELIAGNSRESVGQEVITVPHKRRLISTWKSQLKEKRLSAQVNTEIGKIITMSVTPRTNFDALTRVRRPNILQLFTQDGHALYFRSATTYSPGQTPAFANLDFNTERGSNDPKTILRGDRRVVDSGWYHSFYHGRLHRLDLLGKYRQPYIFIPEPHLHAVLETLYAEGFPRITPKKKIVGSSERELILVRPPLDLPIDLSINEAAAFDLGHYFGIMHAFGLTDRYDRQLEHYAVQSLGNSRRIVNYDPDFIVLDRRPAKARKSDFALDTRLIIDELVKRYTISKFEIQAFADGRKEAMNLVQTLALEKGLNPNTLIYDRLKPRFQDYDQIKPYIKVSPSDEDRLEENK
ncbi:MAG: hypothetical protein WC254_06970 [Candidatus Woesearchaeota archaeon]|jgi:hypothetical protein